MRRLSLITLLLWHISLYANNLRLDSLVLNQEKGRSKSQGQIEGQVYDLENKKNISSATIRINGSEVTAYTNQNGTFRIDGISPGFYTLEVSATGYNDGLSSELYIQGGQTTSTLIYLTPAQSLGEVIIRPKYRRLVSPPLSLNIVGIQQIEKNAGANRDISKLMQTLPGVGLTDPNRNDLIVRGGGPSENVFFLDGIEIPVINHFSTQGASGGVVGIINPDFVNQIKLYTGAYPANRLGGLSSVMEISQREALDDKLHFKATLGASDAALTAEGPINKRSNFIVSFRQSYLKFLFKLIGLPFLPTYNDFQLKYKYQIGDRDELSIIGLGAIDNMTLNTSLQESGTDAQRYLLNNLPIYAQWNYTIGATYKHFANNHIDFVVLSRNMLRNINYKHINNDSNLPKARDYRSDEIENKLRLERTYTHLPFRLLIGLGIKWANYSNSTQASMITPDKSGVVPIEYSSHFSMLGYQSFFQLSDEYFSNKLRLSLGLGMEGNNLTSSMKNPLKQLSPRFSASFSLSEALDLNMNLGRYVMLPSYTTLGYKDRHGKLVNQDTNIKYISSRQIALGGAYKLGKHLEFNFEGYYKDYNNYPISLNDGISLASRMISYGQIGDEAVTSIGKGKTYGIELVSKLKNWHGLNMSIIYTGFSSRFSDINGRMLASSWDTKKQFSINLMYQVGRGWYVASRWRYLGGAPYTPIDMELSKDKAIWGIRNQAYLDYQRYNSERLPASHQLDIRVDKEFYFKGLMLNIYLDIQNVYGAKSRSIPIYTNLNPKGKVIEDPQNNEKQGIRKLENSFGNVLPTLGIVVKL